MYGAIRSSNWSPGDIAIVQGVGKSEPCDTKLPLAHIYLGGLGHLAIQVFVVYTSFGVSLANIRFQYAAKLGLKVYAVSSGSSKAELAKKLGAYEHVDSSTTDVVAYFQAMGGAKLIICTAPNSKLISSIFPAVARYGTITLVSAAVDGNLEVANLLLNMKRATLRGWSCGGGFESDECIQYSVLAGNDQHSHLTLSLPSDP